MTRAHSPDTRRMAETAQHGSGRSPSSGISSKSSQDNPMTSSEDMLALAERLEKRAKQERDWAANSSRVAELLQPEMDKFEARTGHNTYTVRLAVDHRNDAKRYIAEAEDHEAAAASLRATAIIMGDNLRALANRLDELVERVAGHLVGKLGKSSDQVTDLDRAIARAALETPELKAALNAIPAPDRARGFLDAIMERTPKGEWIAVQYHPDGDWSVAREPNTMFGVAHNSECGRRATPDRVEVLECQVASLRGTIRDLVHRARALMACLETHGGTVVPHLMDTDDNPGQYLRDAIETADAALNPKESGR